jgi:hypothetical protein
MSRPIGGRGPKKKNNASTGSTQPRTNLKGKICSWRSDSADSIFLKTLMAQGLIRDGMTPGEVQLKHELFAKYDNKTFASAMYNAKKAFEREADLARRSGSSGECLIAAGFHHHHLRDEIQADFANPTVLPLILQLFLRIPTFVAFRKLIPTTLPWMMTMWIWVVASLVSASAPMTTNTTHSPLTLRPLDTTQMLTWKPTTLESVW